jgi:uracil-DNA glycosylase family 4
VPDFPDSSLQNPLADDCRKCPALCAARERICWGVGPRDADIVVVGEAPAAGNPEAEQWKGGNLTGMAYSGRRSGRKIRTMMEGIDYPNAYYTNAVKCFPPDGEGSNREPTEQERTNCRPYLEREIETVEPRAVVGTGKHATTSLLATDERTIDGFLDSVLEPVALDSLDTILVPILHPSYQEVWISRLDFTYESYLDAIAETLASIG